MLSHILLLRWRALGTMYRIPMANLWSAKVIFYIIMCMGSKRYFVCVVQKCTIFLSVVKSIIDRLGYCCFTTTARCCNVLYCNIAHILVKCAVIWLLQSLKSSTITEILTKTYWIYKTSEYISANQQWVKCNFEKNNNTRVIYVSEKQTFELQRPTHPFATFQLLAARARVKTERDENDVRCSACLV
jgi:hypothetical protein